MSIYKHICMCARLCACKCTHECVWLGCLAGRRLWVQPVTAQPWLLCTIHQSVTSLTAANKYTATDPHSHLAARCIHIHMHVHCTPLAHIPLPHTHTHSATPSSPSRHQAAQTATHPTAHLLIAAFPNNSVSVLFNVNRSKKNGVNY